MKVLSVVSAQAIDCWRHCLCRANSLLALQAKRIGEAAETNSSSSSSSSNQGMCPAPFAACLFERHLSTATLTPAWTRQAAQQQWRHHHPRQAARSNANSSSSSCLVIMLLQLQVVAHAVGTLLLAAAAMAVAVLAWRAWSPRGAHPGAAVSPLRLPPSCALSC